MAYARYYREIIILLGILLLLLLLLVGMGYLPGGGLSGGSDGGGGGGSTDCFNYCYVKGYDTGTGPVDNAIQCSDPMRVVTPIPIAGSNKWCCCSKRASDGSPAGCTDTDAGNDIWKRGTCTDSDSSTTDTCASQTYVNEEWCENGQCWGASMRCPDGYHCFDGACIVLQALCEGVWNPSPSTCSAAYCSAGSCVYDPATIYRPARCICA